MVLSTQEDYMALSLSQTNQAQERNIFRTLPLLLLRNRKEGAALLRQASKYQARRFHSIYEVVL